jgi:hypothetical protein
MHNIERYYCVLPLCAFVSVKKVLVFKYSVPELYRRCRTFSK